MLLEELFNYEKCPICNKPLNISDLSLEVYCFLGCYSQDLFTGEFKIKFNNTTIISLRDINQTNLMIYTPSHYTKIPSMILDKSANIKDFFVQLEKYKILL